ncbi:MAG: ATP-binding cassette subfamily F protein 3 [Planctomycetota bacterium]|jgi:ATP-binding cassette subfamily F protein 3
MVIIALKEVSKAHDASVIFEDVTFEIESNERVGVVGPNGSGKSTLCSLFLGKEQPESGSIMRSRDATIGYLEQHNHYEADHSVLDEGLRAFTDVFELEDQMRVIEANLAEDLGDVQMTRQLNRLSELQEKFDQLGGYGIRAKVESVLIGLGLTKELLERPVVELSGGEAGRLALGKLLLREPDLMILDEPTNHLDIAGCEWLEAYLEKYRGACMIVSHDRYFLDRVTKRTLEVAAGGVTDYGCGYSEYEQRQIDERTRARKIFGEQQGYIRKEREFIRKHMGTQRTKEAKGRQRRLARLEQFDAPRPEDQKIKLALSPKKRLGTEVVDFEELFVGYGDKPLIKDLNVRVEQEDRLGIVGANGAGKSTLLKVLMGKVEALGGTFAIGKTADIGYFDQLQSTINLGLSPYEEIATANLHLTDLQIRSFLARFLFGEDDIHRPLSSFSGGEKSKLMLAKIILSRPNVLVLDEPTNHLDIPSRKALEAVLSDYPGVIITVSHDRFFLDRICNRILWLEKDSHDLGVGNFTQHREKRLARAREAQQLTAQIAAEEKEANKRRQREERKGPKKKPTNKRNLANVEADIMAHEAEKAAILKSMEDPETYRDTSLLKGLNERLQVAENKLKGLEKEWEQFI